MNLRRGIVAPPVLVDLTDVAEMQQIQVDDNGLSIGAAARIADIAGHDGLRARFPAIAEAAAAIAGPTQRRMATLGGNLCLDTRCIYYNQSEWWRAANDHCLKTTGSKCHVAPGSRGICFATYSGDLAPALLVHGAEVDLLGPSGQRRIPLAELYIGRPRQGDPPGGGDGKRFLALEPGEIVTAVQAFDWPGLAGGYEKLRVRRSIDYPVAGVAVALRREGDSLATLRVAVTGTNPCPVLLEGTAALCGDAARPGAAGRAGGADARPDHVDEDHLHLGHVPSPGGLRAGPPAAAAPVRRAQPGSNAGSLSRCSNDSSCVRPPGPRRATKRASC